MGRSTVGRYLVAGALAGAAGTTTLYLVTYLDQAVRGRPSSPLPGRVAGRLAGVAGLDLGEGDRAENRRQGVGALLGILTGVGLGAAYGLARTGVRQVPIPAAGAGVGLAAMVATGTPMTVMGLTDPRTWGTEGWLTDLVPHLGYGLVTVYSFRVMAGARPAPRPQRRP